jgi:hypothetical protein
LDILERAYLAGLFDGEGTVSVTWYLYKPLKRYYARIRVRIGMCHKETIQRVKDVVGQGTVYHRKPDDNRMTINVWTIADRQAGKFLDDIIPFLVTKKEQAKVALDYINLVALQQNQRLHMPERRYKELTDKDWKDRAKLIKRLYALNNAKIVVNPKYLAITA